MAAVPLTDAPVMGPKDRLAECFEELGELMGQRNVIDARIVEVVAEMDHGRMLGITGCRSMSALVAWKTGSTSAHAQTIAAIAHRLPEFPRCVQGMREGRLSLDQVGAIAKKAATGSDEHYAKLAEVATVSQLNTALKLEPPLPPEPDPYREPDPAPKPEPELPPQLTKTHSDDQYVYWKIKLSHLDAATFDAAVASQLDAAIAQWKRDHEDGDLLPQHRPPFPTKGSAFMALVESGADADAARRPHGQHTTVVVHLDLKDQIAQLHLGPLLSPSDRQYLTCDATCEVWFERDGQPLGAGRTTRTISRRLRRALEYRHPTCAVPGCAATRGLHAHHIQHWEDGGHTELDNLVLLCPYHHRAHHRGEITVTGPAPNITVTDTRGRTLTSQSLARPPNRPPPDAPPYRGPIGERAQWKWYDPYEPQPPTTN
ncbi:HNH endonuclease signature motif containing protein [Mycobacterium sp. NPDC051804]|uniref:HNH endonuclease signature motif containing protein n=1 Tax=Mycobacterium sp. NPDC051804 TaxID=3364295 RepID=UPI003796E5AF